nr:hypothetical protein [Tanacetum cinerariifolium]
MHSRFEMSLMGEKNFFLRLQIHQSLHDIFINQAKYALEILHKHDMEKGQSIGTPMATKPKLDANLSGNPVDQTDYRSKIGSLMYLTSSRPDIVRAVCSSFGLTAFSDADHARCIDTHKSTSRGIQFQGDKLVSWMTKKQDCTVMSLAKAEYMALSTSCAQIMWTRTQLQDYGLHYNKIPLYYDSQSAIAISCNPVQHSRTKHIHTRYHFIKEQVENVKMEILLEPTSNKLLVESRKLKHKDKDFANSDIQDLPSRCQVYQGILLASFQDDAKYEHGGQDTRSQGRKRRSRQKDKDLKISDEKTKSKDNDKRLKIKDHKA